MLGAHHPLLKSIRKAIQRGACTEDGFAIAEGFHLFREAQRANSPIGAILATAKAAAQLEEAAPRRLLEERLFQQISSLETSQGLLFLVRVDASGLDTILSFPALAIVLDGLQDPGNAGAIVRSAEAFGATGAIFLKGTVSPWNPKTLRASAGSIFRLPFAVCDWDELQTALKDREIALYSAAPRAAKSITEVPLHKPAAILIGNEGRGIPPGHENAALAVRIPTKSVESLNAALAAGIFLYEASRQRS